MGLLVAPSTVEPKYILVVFTAYKYTFSLCFFCIVADCQN